MKTKTNHRAQWTKQGIPEVECLSKMCVWWVRMHMTQDRQETLCHVRYSEKQCKKLEKWGLYSRKPLGIVLSHIQSRRTTGKLEDLFSRKLLLEVSTNVLQGWILGVRESSMFNKILLDVPNLSRPGFLEVIVFPLPAILLLPSAVEEVPRLALLTRHTHVPYSNTSLTLATI